MQIPKAVARFNLKVTNPIQSLWAGRLVPWAIVIHKGRKSGREYRTPVLAFKTSDGLAIVLTYGEDVQWLKNLEAAGGGTVERAGKMLQVSDPRVVNAADADGAARRARRAFERVLLLRADL